jgi:hypothetical protein
MSSSNNSSNTITTLQDQLYSALDELSDNFNSRAKSILNGGHTYQDILKSVTHDVKGMINPGNILGIITGSGVTEDQLKVVERIAVKTLALQAIHKVNNH